MKIEIGNNDVVDSATFETTEHACVIYIWTHKKGVYHDRTISGFCFDEDKPRKTLSFEFDVDEDRLNPDYVKIIAENRSDAAKLSKYRFTLTNKDEIIILIPNNNVWITE